VTGWTAREAYLYVQEALGNTWPARMVEEMEEGEVMEARMDLMIALINGDYDGPVAVSAPMALSFSRTQRRWQ
jgi:hypothetical protein